MKHIKILGIFAVLLILLVACGVEQSSNLIDGTWNYTEEHDEELMLSLNFKDDGIVIGKYQQEDFEDLSGKYIYEDNKLTITLDDHTEDYEVEEIDSEHLTLYFLDNGTRTGEIGKLEKVE